MDSAAPAKTLVQTRPILPPGLDVEINRSSWDAFQPLEKAGDAHLAGRDVTFGLFGRLV